MLATTTLCWVREPSRFWRGEAKAAYRIPILKITAAPNFCEKGNCIFHKEGMGRNRTIVFVLIFRTLCHKVTVYMHVSFMAVGLIHSAGTIIVIIIV